MKRLLLSLILVLLPSPCFAVTEFISTVNKTGEDYNTVALWEAAMDDAGDITDGTVKCGNWDNQTGGDIADATAVSWDAGGSTGTLIHMTSSQYCIDVTGGSLADDDTVSDGGNTFDINGSPDSCILTAYVYDDDGVLTDALDVSGNTGNSTNYLKVTAPVGERHNGIYGNGATIQATASYYEPFDVVVAGTVIEWLGINLAMSNCNGCAAVEARADGVIIRNNVLTTADSKSNPGYCVRNRQINPVYIYDNFCIDSYDNGIHIDSTSNPQAEVYNNTILNAGNDGIHINDTTNLCIVKNNLVLNAATNCLALGNATVLTNGTSDATGSAGLTNLVTANEITDTTNNAENLHLLVGATARGAGTDLGTTPSGVQFDIDNRDRDTEGDTWDVGADQYVSASVNGARRIIIF